MPSYDLVCQGCAHKFEVFCILAKKIIKNVQDELSAVRAQKLK